MKITNTLLFLGTSLMAPTNIWACETAPDDAEILTCRYASTFNAENCADFPIALGWTAESVSEFCQGQPGAKAETVVVSQQDSCLVTIGNIETASRCRVNHEETQTWFGYGVPEYICTNFVKGEFEQGPFCTAYETNDEEEIPEEEIPLDETPAP